MSSASGVSVRRPRQRARSSGAVVRPLALQTHGAVWPATAPAVIAAAVWAFAIWAMAQLGLLPNLGAGSASLSGVLSMIVGLLVSYRDRWHEGRKLWATMTSTQRTLVRTLALSLPPRDSAGQEVYVDTVRSIFQLIAAFPSALKWHLREAHALGHSDVRSLLSDENIARIDPTSASTPGSKASLPRHASEHSREQHLLNDDDSTSLRRRAQPAKHTSNVPLAMIREIHRLLNECHTAPVKTAGAPEGDKPALEIPTWASTLGLLDRLTDCVTNMERIHDTPVPVVMAVHLKQLLILHLAAIPPSLVGTLGISAAIAAHVFMGVDCAAEALSDPFGFDSNDLPLDRYCADLLRETQDIIGTQWLPSAPVSDIQPGQIALDEAPRRRIPVMGGRGRPTPDTDATT